MRTDEEIEREIEMAEAEIQAILKKRKLYIGMLYDDGVALTLGAQEEHDNGDIHVFEREAF